MTYDKPLPSPSSESEAFWAGCRHGELVLQRCDGCHALRFPPSPFCPECWSASFEYQPVSGRGKVYTYAIYQRVYHPGFAGEVPYVVAVIELAEGPRMISNVIGCDPSEVRCDMPVEVTFEKATDAIVLPKFRPIRPG